MNSATDILKCIETKFSTYGSSKDISINNAKPIQNADLNSIVWVLASRPDREELVRATNARAIVCSPDFPYDTYNDKFFILVENPRLTYLRIIDKLFSSKPSFGIHPTAFIHPDADVHKETYIGPFTYIGKSTIGKGSIIYGHCHIYDNVVIRDHVQIHAGTIIGADGFGYQKNEQGALEKFPHLGGVLIENDVEIGANTCIDKGTLGNTHIKKGAKIDNLVHIAHNVIVGENAAVIALAMVGGSTIIGDNAWIAPSVALRDGIQIHDGATAGMGSVVTKSIPANETWTGNPAKELKAFIKMQNQLKNL